MITYGIAGTAIKAYGVLLPGDDLAAVIVCGKPQRDCVFATCKSRRKAGARLRPLLDLSSGGWTWMAVATAIVKVADQCHGVAYFIRFSEVRPAATMIAAGLSDPRTKIEMEVTVRKGCKGPRSDTATHDS